MARNKIFIKFWRGTKNISFLPIFSLLPFRKIPSSLVLGIYIAGQNAHYVRVNALPRNAKNNRHLEVLTNSMSLDRLVAERDAVVSKFERDTVVSKLERAINVSNRKEVRPRHRSLITKTSSTSIRTACFQAIPMVTRGGGAHASSAPHRRWIRTIYTRARSRPRITFPPGRDTPPTTTMMIPAGTSSVISPSASASLVVTVS